MTTINTNTSAILARTFAMQASDRQRTSMERLSSGLRINSSADDAAGLAVSTKMQSQLTSMNSALRNSMDGVSLIQTAMSSMSTITNIVQRMRELSVQMHNGVYTNSDRENAQLEIMQLLGSISQIAETTAFNNVLLLDGSYQNKIRAGHTNSEVIDLLIDGMGILPYIKGNSYASSLLSSTILRPITSANGTSLLDYLATSFARGTSVLDIINQSNATGSSSFQTRATDTATGNSNIDILSNASPTGTSVFNTPSTSNGSGSSQIDFLANVSGAGSSVFRVPNASNASGASQLDLLNNNTATGASNFDNALTSDASGSSLLNIRTTNVAVGSSSFDLLANSRAGGSSQVDLLATNSATGSSAFNTPSSSTANGSTNLDIANATFGTNISSADTAASSTANGLSGRSILPNATASGTSYLNTLQTSTPISSSSVIAGLASSSIATVTSTSQITPLLFENGNFQYGGSKESYGSGTSSIPGWNIVLEQVNLGDSGQQVTNLIKVNNTTIASPSDPGGANDNQRVLSDNGNPTTFKFNASNGQISLGTNSVRTSAPNAAMHGPYLTSKTPYALSAGDQVYFDWGVKANGDAADVYAFLVDTSTNQTIELLNYQQTAPGSKGFTRNTTTINSSGNYNFVFVSGSYDADGGQILGSELLLKNVGITQANPASAAITTSAVTLSAQESNSVSISNSKMAELYKKAQADGFNGNFEILPRGSDYSNFSIDRNTGNITSTTLRQTNKSAYSFDVRYNKSDGSGHHTESVTLNLTATERASSNISMQEGSTLVIERANLSLLNNYVNVNGAGTYRFSSDSPDANKFNIDANTGRITSRYPLDFDVQKNYAFDIIFRKLSDGSEFVNSVALALTDTLDSVAVLTSEESNRVSISNTVLSTILAYSNEDQQRGTFSISNSGDGSYFSVDAYGNVTSNQSLLLANKGAYQFSLNYRGINGITHTENITLSLTEALQATSTLSANEASSITINASTLTKIYGFASRNGPGQYSIVQNGPDYSKFSINSSTGQITNTAPLDPSAQSNYTFDVVFTSSADGRQFVETVNLSLADNNNPVTTVTTPETDSLNIPAGTLTSSATFAFNFGGGQYSLTGAAANKFDINTSTGEISSKVGETFRVPTANTYNFEDQLEFNVVYTSGANSHTEKIKLKITETLNSVSTLSAHESGQVSISPSSLITGFAGRDRNRGSYQIVASGNDHAKFSINASTGEITSNGALDFDTQVNYSFDIKYTAASDGRQFKETINLAITDTLSSSATLTAEETQSLTIAEDTLTSTEHYATTKDGAGETGTYTLTGTHANLFTIANDGAITSNGTINKGPYSFNVNYTDGAGATHVEAVTLNVTRALQGSSTMTAQEANIVKIFKDDLTELRSFVTADGSNGTYRFGPGRPDASLFEFDSFNNIQSKAPLDFDTQQSYVFDVIYRASDGREYTDTVTLNLLDTLRSTATLTAEETQSLTIAEDTLTSTEHYATTKDGAGETGTYTLTGTHANLFTIANDGAITSNGTINKGTYSFNVNYRDGAGATHVEAVTLNVTEALQSSSTLLAAEANTVGINTSAMSNLASFASRYGGGTYLPLTGADANKFNINSSTGRVTSKAPLDFDTQQSYVFDIIYRANVGGTPTNFTETVTLNLLDTLRSTATLTAEETQSLTIAEDTLTSTEHYATTKDGAGETGTYTLTGTHANLFTIANDGAITSNGTINKGTYSFNVNYRDGAGATHVEAVTLNVTEALQSSSTLSAAEANTVGINTSAMSNLASFASRYGGGTYLPLTGADANKFNINSSTGRVTSKAPLDFDTQQSYVFDIIYRANVGGTLTNFTETVTLNLLDTLVSDASITAEETQSLTISAATLSSTNSFAAKDPGVGAYSLTGADANLFNVDANGNVTSLGTITKGNYNFNVVYTASNGPIHTEQVVLNLTEALQGSSTISAHEANQITITSNVMSSINGFAARDGFGHYRIAATGSDYNKFTINRDSGTITSVGNIEYDTQSSFTFDVIYDGSDGRKFTETVTLNIGDTLSSSATLSAEETNLLTIGAATLSSTNAFATKDPGVGSYNLGGADAGLFNIDNNGNITSKNPMLRSNKSSYNFDVSYTSSTGKTHVENVSLSLTEALQSISTLSAFEADTVVINPGTSSHLNAFASRDNFNGRYSLGGADSSQFIISNTGIVTSRNNLEYDNQNSYNIDVIYRGGDGRIFTDAVTLSLKDTLLSKAVIYAEQSHDVDIAAATLSSTNAFASKDIGVGSYRLTGADASKFTVDTSGNITSNGSLLQANQLEYKFNVIYLSSTGKEHLEDVTLHLTESLQSTATMTAQEANRVYLTSNSMQYLHGFAERDNFTGGWRVLNTGPDHNLFEISADGTVQSKAPLDFSTQNQYSFKIGYQTGDATREFVQTVNLALKDTLTGTATLRAEEGEIVELDANIFTATNAYIAATGSGGGTYRLDPSTEDYDQFTINSTTGSIRSKEELRLANESDFDLRVIYTRPDGIEFSETIDMTLTETTFNKSRSDLTATKSQIVNIGLDRLPNISRFVKNDQQAGNFRLTPDATNSSDYKKFTVDNNGNIQSTEPLDFESDKTEYNFRLEYDFGNGPGSYEENIKLTITNDLRDDNNLNLSGIDISTAQGAKEAMTVLDETIVRLAASQAKIGATQNRIQHNINNLFNSTQITDVATGRIMDADFAIETTSLAKQAILNRAATAMLAQANQTKTNVLKLIKF